MATSRPAAQAAFVLHHWAWSETSLILDLLTRESGRVTAVAKGAKRPYSQQRSVLLPFQRIAVSLGRQKADDSSDVFTLRSAEYLGGAPMLPPARLFSGFYLNELMMKLLGKQDAHPRLFDDYADTLCALAQPDDHGAEVVLRAFELRLLQETGVLPELDRSTAAQQPLDPSASYGLSPESGLMVASEADESSMPAVDCLALQAALMANDPTQLRAACVPVLPALKRQLRPLLHYHLGSSHLRTRQAMVEVHRLLDVDTMHAPS